MENRGESAEWQEKKIEVDEERWSRGRRNQRQVHTSDEECKLTLIRVKKGKTEDDVWTVVMHPGGIQR